MLVVNIVTTIRRHLIEMQVQRGFLEQLRSTLRKDLSMEKGAFLHVLARLKEAIRS